MSSDGTITVRKPNDYVSAMIGLAGGTYSLGNYTDEEKNALSTMKMQMEDFYSAEIDADVLIYNGTIEGELTSIDELVKKNSLFADFQAVKSGQVYTTGSNFYQQSTGTCDFIEDLNQILTGEGDTLKFSLDQKGVLTMDVNICTTWNYKCNMTIESLDQTYLPKFITFFKEFLEREPK